LLADLAEGHLSTGGGCESLRRAACPHISM
jgi:hypothetical protein